MSPRKQQTQETPGNGRKRLSVRSIQAIQAQIEKHRKRAKDYKEKARKEEEKAKQKEEELKSLESKVKKVLEDKRRELDKTLSLFN